MGQTKQAKFRKITEFITKIQLLVRKQFLGVRLMSLKLIKLFFIGLVVISIAGAMFIWFGAFNIAGNDKHWDITTSALEVIRDRSISTRSSDIKVPNLSDKERIAKAAPNYAAMCAQCHLAPGIEKSELYEGLYPQPPVFYKLDKYTRKPEEIFWITQNGLKMTGMPAWGIYNSDEQIWDLVALLSKINDMSAEQYQKLVDAGEHTHGKGGDMDGGHKESLTTKQPAPNKNKHNSDGHKH